MLVAAEKIAFRSNTLASGQMDTAVNTSDHILTFERLRLFMHLLAFFESAAVTSYYPEKKKDNKGEEQDSTQAGISVAVSKPAASS
ncbi:MAG: hypothetical protein J0H48_12620 [Nitrosospira multiformis]|nr:hypothetical protein [Nitrosospira multiformis]